MYTMETLILNKIESGEYKITNAAGSSDIWKYFDKIEVTETKELVPYAICSKCLKLFKFGKGTSSSNLKKHACYKRKINDASYSDQLKREPVNTGEQFREEHNFLNPIKWASVNINDPLHEECAYPTPVKGTLDNVKDQLHEEYNYTTPAKRMLGTVNDQLREEVLQSCVKFVCHGLQPFEIINDEGFKELAQCLIEVGVQIGSSNFSIDDILPESTKISDRLHTLHLSEREKFINDIRPFIEKGMCASTVDFWTNSKNQRNFITFTLHYVDNNWQLQSRILFTTKLENCDNNIISAIEVKFDELNLKRELLKNITFTTDQDSNIKDPLQHNWRINNCLSHILEIILEQTFDKETLKSCAPHVLDMITKCETIMESLKRKGKYPIEIATEQEYPSSWNTEFKALYSFGKNFNFIVDIFKKSGESNHLNGFERSLLDKLINILEPFKNLSLLLENEKNPTIHLVLLHMHILKAKLFELLHKEIPNEIKLTLSNCLNNIFHTQFKPNKIHKISAFLWPQYKQMRYLNESERDEGYNLVKAELIEISRITPREISQSTQPTNEEMKYGIDDDMLSKYRDVYLQTTDNNSKSQIDMQIEMYKNSCYIENDISTWWRLHGDEFPLLSKLARKILCIPSTSSAAPGRCSNLTKRILEERRTNLSGENVDAILFLYSLQKNPLFI